MVREKSVPTVRTVERALNLLFRVAESSQPLGLSEISEASGVDKSTALRLLRTLESFRLVDRNADTKYFSLGSGAWQLSRSYQDDLKALAHPHLLRLREATGETVILVVARGLERIVLHAVEATHELRVVPALNNVVPVYSGAAGRVFMAFMPEAERDRIIDATGLRPVNERGMTDRASFVASLDAVRRDGSAVSIGDVTLGISAIAAPVFARTGGVVAAISLRGPEARMDEERLARLTPLVREGAHAISSELGHQASEFAVKSVS
ncbi:IclR family transcriptional regulator [Pikeienuella sp. HZG-20]|uniref:IclR family transcriptional regulator n=1 Tax=Paludibacillus litoralis TaxID=3133267 RepID=UPI0030EE4729